MVIFVLIFFIFFRGSDRGPSMIFIHYYWGFKHIGSLPNVVRLEDSLFYVVFYLGVFIDSCVIFKLWCIYDKYLFVIYIYYKVVLNNFCMKEIMYSKVLFGPTNRCATLIYYCFSQTIHINYLFWLLCFKKYRCFNLKLCDLTYSTTTHIAITCCILF